MSNSKIRSALILNPRSRKAKLDPGFVDEIKELYGGRGAVFEKGDELDLREFLNSIADQNVGLIYIFGGDGTIRMVLDATIHAYAGRQLPSFGVLGGGTMNIVASTLDVGRNPARVLRRYLRAEDRRPLPTVKRHVLKVNDRRGFIFVMGGFSNFLNLYYQRSTPTPAWGLFLVARVLLSRVFSGPFYRSLFSREAVILSIDGEPSYHEELVSFGAASVQDMGFHARPFLVSYEKGVFGFLGFRSISKSLLFQLPRVFLGKPMSAPSILQGSARKVELQWETKAASYLDGDLLEPNDTFTISLGECIECLDV